MLQVEWEKNENEEFDMDQLWNGLNQGTQNPGVIFREEGDVEQGIEDAKLEDERNRAKVNE